MSKSWKAMYEDAIRVRRNDLARLCALEKALYHQLHDCPICKHPDANHFENGYGLYRVQTHGRMRLLPS